MAEAETDNIPNFCHFHAVLRKILPNNGLDSL